MKEKSLKKIINIIVILIIVLLLTILIINIVNIKNKKEIIRQQEKSRESEILNSITYQGERLEEDVVTPEKSYVLFSKYSGEVTTLHAYRTIYNIANKIIPDYYKKLKTSKDNEIKQFFNSNKDKIATDIGIDNVENFVGLIKGICKLNGDDIKFENYKFDEETVKQDGNTVSANLIIQYENNKDLTINITLLEKQETSIVKIKFIN